MVQSNRCQPNGLRIVDRSDNVLEMPTENPAVVGRECGKLSTGAPSRPQGSCELRGDCADPPVAEATASPSMFLSTCCCQIANSPWRTSIPIIRRAIHNVQEIAQTTRGGGNGRGRPDLTHFSHVIDRLSRIRVVIP